MFSYQKNKLAKFSILAFFVLVTFFVISKLYNYNVVGKLNGIDVTQVRSESVEPLSHSNLIVSFWGAWCRACANDHHLLMDLASQGIPMVGVNMMDIKSDSEQWLLSRGNPYVLHIDDTDGSISKQNGIGGAPVFLVVNTEGELLFRHEGVLTEPVVKLLAKEYFSM